jgi:polyphosphate kinase 2 (PPK2 family)
VPPGLTIALADWPTLVKPVYQSTKNYERLLARRVVALSDLQQFREASNRCALLPIFQAMAAAGKDGVIQHVMSGVNPKGSGVYSFKHPAPEELDHDFLWRTTRGTCRSAPRSASSTVPTM